MRHESDALERCPNCASYRIVTDNRPELDIDLPYVVLCKACGWGSWEEDHPADGDQSPSG
jgi:hypothetical protein